MGQSSEKTVKLELQFSSPHEVMLCIFLALIPDDTGSTATREVHPSPGAQSVLLELHQDLIVWLSFSFQFF